MKWIDRETTPVVYDEVPLFRSVQGDGSTSRPLWPIGLAIAAGLVIGFSSGYLVGARQRQAPSPAAGVPPLADASRALETQPASNVKPTAAAPAASNVLPASPAQPPSKATLRAGSESTSESTTASTANAPAKESAPAAARPAKTEPVADARLQISSVPAGAIVTVDGVERGRTPTTVRDLVPGTHRLRIARDGYVTDNRRVDVTRSRRPNSIRVTLQRIAPPAAGRAAGASPQRPPESVNALKGEVDVQSRPAGAQVFLDGKLVGTTPMTIDSASPGEHVLRLEHDGYRRWTSSIRVVGGQRARVAASLER